MTSSQREVETKFSVHGLFALPDLVDPGNGIVSEQRRPRLNLRATYHDTPSLRLAREGVTLRHRTGEGAPRWTLKLPTSSSSRKGLVRDEISVEGDDVAVPDELHLLLTAFLRGEGVAPVAVLATHRETHALLDADGGELAEVVDDTVSLLEGRRVLTRFREIEIEQGKADGARAACRATGRRLLDAGAVAGEQLPKVVRALGPQAQGPSDLPAPPDVTPTSPAADLVRWSMRTALARLVAADIGVRRGEADSVHQMRVACRRLRSDLRTFADLIDDARAEPLRAELTWLATSLGDARDLEVLRARVAQTAGRDALLPIDRAGLTRVRRLLTDQHDAALIGTQAALDTDRYVAVLVLLEDTARDPALAELADKPCKDLLPDLVGTSWRRLAKRAGQLTHDAPDHEWHRARILAKRARYAAEVAAVALGKDARSTAKAATKVQEVLGEHQDAAIAADRLLVLASTAPHDVALAVTCGRLAERERVAVLEARDRFHGVWRRVRNGKATRWLPS